MPAADRKRVRLQPDTRRELLMAAAARTFARLGFRGTRMDDIAVEAGVAKGLLYRHFPSKESMFRALMEESGAEFTRRLRASWADAVGRPDAGPWDMVDAGLRTFVEEASDPETMLNWIEPAQWELVSAYRDQTLQAIADELVGLQPDLDHNVAWLIAAMFQGSLEGGILEWRRRGGATTPEVFELVRAFALRGLDGIRSHLALNVPEIPPIAARGPRRATNRTGSRTGREKPRR